MPDASPGPLTVEIRPGMSILGVLQHLNYRAWYAMAEFVDNAVQSYLSEHDKLTALHGPNFALRVSIEVESGDDPRILIRDNAAGIPSSEFPRAFRPAAVPPDRSGLSEFGMGMKSAACWFANKWSVRTTAIGEPYEYTVEFDIEKIVVDDITELQIHRRPAPPEHHYTELALSELNQPLRGRTLGKVKDHLASMYRNFIRPGQMQLLFNNQPLVFDDPPVLVAPPAKDLSAPPKEWSKYIEISLGGNKTITGVASLRATASPSHAGFALFRRNRLILGSADEAWRPERIFGPQNKFVYQRLFGELVVEGFEVSHTKDGFRWAEHEDAILEKLAEALNAEPLPLLTQARQHRQRLQPKDIEPVAREALQHTATAIQEQVPAVIHDHIAHAPPVVAPPTALPPQDTQSLALDVFDVPVEDEIWRVHLEFTNDPAIGDWLSTFQNVPPNQPGLRHLGLRLSLAHPFSLAFADPNGDHIEVMLRLAVAMLIAENTARDAGVQFAGTFIRHINELLIGALSSNR